MMNNPIFKNIIHVLIPGFAFFMLVNYLSINGLLLSFLRSHNKVIAKVISYKNEDGAGYYVSKAIVEYNYSDHSFVSNIELNGVSLHENVEYIPIYVCSEDGKTITTKTNLLFELGSLSLCIVFGAIWLYNTIRFIKILTSFLRTRSIKRKADTTHRSRERLVREP